MPAPAVRWRDTLSRQPSEPPGLPRIAYEASQHLGAVAGSALAVFLAGWGRASGFFRRTHGCPSTPRIRALLRRRSGAFEAGRVKGLNSSGLPAEADPAAAVRASSLREEMDVKSEQRGCARYWARSRMDP